MVDGRPVHLRMGGRGPTILALHDSPRSGLLHEPLIQALRADFTVVAPDTPGYGASAPLPAPEGRDYDIGDFADALIRLIEVAGLAPVAVYAFHTSSKIALEAARRVPQLFSHVLTDGLSIPVGAPDLDFIARYMKPFVLKEDGSHLAEQWAKVRDLHRFFPWFAAAPPARIPMNLPEAGDLHAYGMDLLMAGTHFSDAYAAAMRYDPRPALPELKVPVTFSCRADDVLYAHLDRLPQPLPPGAAIARVTGGRDAWLDLIRTVLGPLAGPAPVLPLAPMGPAYASHDGTQLMWRRRGPPGTPPVLLLHDMPGGGGGFKALRKMIAQSNRVYVPDLPGFGQSDPLTGGDGLEEAARRLDRALAGETADPVMIGAAGWSAPLALTLAMRLGPSRCRGVVLDRPAAVAADARAETARAIAPDLAPADSGGHWQAAWHMARDAELSFPWFARGMAAIRPGPLGIEAAAVQGRALDLLKHPFDYGHVWRAAVKADIAHLLDGAAAMHLPVTIIRDQRDPQSAAVPQAPHEAERPAAAEEAAARLRDLLTGQFLIRK